MKVRTKKGRVLNLANDETLAALLDAEVVEVVMEPPRKLPEPVVEWQVGRSVTTREPHIIGKCQRCGEVLPILEAPESVNWGHCGLNSKPPKEIIKRFRELKDQILL